MLSVPDYISGVLKASGLSFDEQSIAAMQPGSSVNFQLSSFRSSLIMTDTDSFVVSISIACGIKPSEQESQILYILSKALPFYNEHEINLCLLQASHESTVINESGIIRAGLLSGERFALQNEEVSNLVCDLCMETRICVQEQHLSGCLKELETIYQIAHWLRSQWLNM